MSPEVVQAKIRVLQQVLLDLRKHIVASREEQQSAHYEIERQVQLAVDLCVAIGRRILFLNDIPIPDTARQVILLLGQRKFISKKLAHALANGVGLRNLIVHEYGVLDYDVFFSGLKDGYRSFVKFAEFSGKPARFMKDV